MKSWTALIVIFLWTVWSCCVDAATNHVDPVVRSIQLRAEEARRDEKVPGAAMAIVEGDQILMATGFGYADAREKTPVSPQTRFTLGGITKLFTAIAVMQQVEKGRFSLDTPVTEALPGLTIENRYKAGTAPTIREVLSHHGGLPNAVVAGNYLDQPRKALVPLGDLYISQPIGEIYAYSNLGYALLGHLIEHHSGMTYSEYVQQSVFQPLGLTGAGFQQLPGDSRGHSKRGKVRPDIFPRDLSALGARGSVADLARLMTWLLQDNTAPVLSRRNLDQMARVQNTDAPLDLDNESGLAWQLTNLGRFGVQRVLRLNAVTMQFRGLILLVPEHQLGVAIVANSSNALDFVLEQGRLAMDDLLQARAGIPPPNRKTTIPDFVPMPAGAKVANMAARYNTPLGLLDITVKNQQFDVRYLGRRFRMRPREDGWYDIAYRLLGLINLRFNIIREVLFRPVTLGGHHVLLLHYQGQDFLFGTGLADSATTGNHSARAGIYELRNPDAFSERLELEKVEITYEDGNLYALYRLPMFMTLKPKIPLLPIDSEHFYTPGLGTAMGERVTFLDDGGFEFSGYRFGRRR